MKKKYIIIFLVLLPVIAYALLYNNLPDLIPMHFNSSGVVDRYGDKFELLILVFMPLFIVAVFEISPIIDPKKDNYQKFSTFYEAFKIVMVLFMDILFFIVVYLSFYPDSFNISKLILILIGLLFIFIGNYMPQAKQNFFFGIKTPWTLSNETVWIKTHRIGGYCFIICGFIMIITAFLFSQNMSIILIFTLLFTVFVPLIMSYVYYKKEVQE